MKKDMSYTNEEWFLSFSGSRVTSLQYELEYVLDIIIIYFYTCNLMASSYGGLTEIGLTDEEEDLYACPFDDTLVQCV